MGQSKLSSAVEAGLNTITGFVISCLAAFFVFPIVGIHSSTSQNIMSVSLFTGISVVRSYIWRRIFNHIHHKARVE